MDVIFGGMECQRYTVLLGLKWYRASTTKMPGVLEGQVLDSSGYLDSRWCGSNNSASSMGQDQEVRHPESLDPPVHPLLMNRLRRIEYASLPHITCAGNRIVSVRRAARLGLLAADIHGRSNPRGMSERGAVEFHHLSRSAHRATPVFCCTAFLRRESPSSV